MLLLPPLPSTSVLSHQAFPVAFPANGQRETEKECVLDSFFIFKLPNGDQLKYQMRIKLDDVSADQGGEEKAELGWSHCLGFFELSELILTTSKTGYVCKYPLTLFISHRINCLLHKTQNRELVMLQIHNTTLLKFHKSPPHPWQLLFATRVEYIIIAAASVMEWSMNSIFYVFQVRFQKLAQ